MTIESLIDAKVTRALNVCKTPDGWQASLERKPGVFTIRVESTPSRAIEAVLLGEPTAGSVFD